MSKELIERLRELSASRKPYATGAHGQIIGMESYRIVANGFALECIDEAADRIEELERDLLNLVCRIHRDGGHYIAKYGEAKAIADADTVAAQNNADLDALQADRDEWKARAEFSYRQRDELNRLCEFNEKTMSALQADNARLRESTELLLIARQIGHYRDEWDMLKEALAATPEQSLAAYRNKVIEDCAERAEAYAYMSQNFNALSAEELRAMKEQP